MKEEWVEECTLGGKRRGERNAPVEGEERDRGMDYWMRKKMKEKI